MTMQADEIRTLSAQECDGVSGGVGWIPFVLALGGGAAFGSILAVCTTEKAEEPLVPKIEFPPEKY